MEHVTTFSTTEEMSRAIDELAQQAKQNSQLYSMLGGLGSSLGGLSGSIGYPQLGSFNELGGKLEKLDHGQLIADLRRMHVEAGYALPPPPREWWEDVYDEIEAERREAAETSPVVRALVVTACVGLIVVGLGMAGKNLLARVFQPPPEPSVSVESTTAPHSDIWQGYTVKNALIQGAVIENRDSGESGWVSPPGLAESPYGWSKSQKFHQFGTEE